MSDNFYRDPTWLAAALGAAASAVTTFIGTVLWGRKRLSIDESQALSKSERDFRIDILAELKEIKAALAQCERERLDCAEREVNTHGEIEKLRDEVRDLRARLPQHELPLQARA